jgi:hypothetical protein
MVKKMKYVYNWYVKASQEGIKKMISDNKYGPNWVAKVKEVGKKAGVKLLFVGSPFGTAEQYIVAIESDHALDEFYKVTGELYRIDPAMIEYAKTEIILVM